MENFRLPQIEYREMVCPQCHRQIVLPILNYESKARPMLNYLADLSKKRKVLDDEINELTKLIKEASTY
jgi:hypothetical protein